jgi:hypothetical protein
MKLQDFKLDCDSELPLLACVRLLVYKRNSGMKVWTSKPMPTNRAIYLAVNVSPDPFWKTYREQSSMPFGGPNSKTSIGAFSMHKLADRALRMIEVVDANAIEDPDGLPF